MNAITGVTDVLTSVPAAEKLRAGELLEHFLDQYELFDCHCQDRNDHSHQK
jgi:hypothetical protein